MRIFKNAVHSKIESAINLEIRGQIKINLDAFNLGHRDHMYAVSSKSVSVPCRALSLSLSLLLPLYLLLALCGFLEDGCHRISCKLSSSEKRR